jgi:hypothetical protein
LENDSFVGSLRRNSKHEKVKFNALIKFLLILSLGFYKSGLIAQGFNYGWSRAFGSIDVSNVWTRALDTDGTGNIYYAAMFQGTIDADPGPDTVQIANADGASALLCKFRPDGTFVWAKQLTSTSQISIQAMKVDAVGNIIVAGIIQGESDADPTLNAYLLQATNPEFFLAKYDSSGTLLWAGEFNNVGSAANYQHTYISGIEVDVFGDITITGAMDPPIDFDPSAANATVLIQGTYQAFVAKYTSAGTYVNAFRISGTGARCEGSGITSDATGNIFVAGAFAGTVDLNPGAGTNNVTATSTTSDGFLVKYNSSGVYQSGFRFGNTGTTVVDDIVLNTNGNVLIAGQFAGTVDFDPSGSVNSMASSAGNTFLATYTPTCTFSSVTQIGSTIKNVDLEVASNGDVYLGAEFNGSADFAPGASTFVVTGTSSDNLAYARYTSSLGLVWAFGLVPSVVFANSIAVNPSNDLIGAASFYGTIDLDPGSGSNVQSTFLNFPGYGSVLSKYAAANGAPLFGESIVTLKRDSVDLPSYDEIEQIAIDAFGNNYAIGSFEGNVDFDPASSQGMTICRANNSPFIIKHDANGQFQWVKTICHFTSGENVVFNDFAIESGGNLLIVGRFNGTIDFDPGAGISNLTSSVGNTDAFMLKLTPAGTFVSVIKLFAGTNTITSIALNSAGDVYLTGYIFTTVNFNPNGAAVNLTGAGSFSGFIARYTNAGSYLFAGLIDGPGGENLEKIAIDPAGKIWITGFTAATNAIDFDPGPGTAIPSVTGTTFSFLARYEPTCSLSTYFILSGAASNVLAYSMDIDPVGNILLGGAMYTATDFDFGPGTATRTPSVGGDNFVAKYSNSGTFRWVAQLNGNPTATRVGSLGNGGVVLSHRVQNQADTDPTSTVNTVTGYYRKNMMVMLLDSSGNYATHHIFGYNGNASTNVIKPSGTNDFYLGGAYGYYIDFDPGLAVDMRIANSNRDAFIAKYSSLCAAPAQPANINGSATPCQGATVTYSVATVPGATGYTWTLPAGWTGSSTTNSITATASSTSGNITVTADNGCGSSTVQTLAVTVTPDPAQPGTISGNDSICTGSSNTYSITAIPGATSYTWTLPGGWSGTSTTNSIATTAGTNGGNVTVTANNACGSSTAQTLAITITPAPAQPGPISGNISVCVGTPQPYGVSAVPGATSYTWTLPSGWSGLGTSNNISPMAGPNSGNISVVANNACGSSSPQSLAVTVSSQPAQPGSITGNITVCQGSTNTYAVTAVPGATSYTWTYPGGWSGSSTSNSIVTTASATSGNVTVVANNACGSSVAQTLSVTVTPAPAQPGAISGNTTICAGSSNSYSVAAVPGATSYTWTYPGGWSGSSTTNSIATTAGATSGNVTVVANNACGSSTVQTLAVTITPAPAQPGAISGNTSVCAGSSNSYSVAAVPGATSYTWTYPGGWSGSSTSNSIATTAGATSGNVTVVANNACGSSTSQTLAVTVNPTPAQPGAISGNTTVCAGSSNTYSVAAVPGATSYTWTYPGGWSGSSTSNSIATTAGATSGNVTVVANNA